MPRFVAFLRGVSPMNAKMPELKAAFEVAGFTAVRTLLSSGNVAFDAKARSEAAVAKAAEAAMESRLGRSFLTVVRASKELQALIAADPFAAFDVPDDAKRVVTFLREPREAKLKLPIEGDGVSILALRGREAFTAYRRGPDSPVFMVMIEKAFGKDQTTRTWDTVRKCAEA